MKGRRGRARTRFLADADESSVVCHPFRDGYFPYVGGAVKDVFEGLKQTVDPDVIFTHARHDLHQDHRLVCELTWNTWRDHLVLEYEIPKYDGDLGTPNLFVEVSEELAREKTDELESAFASQRAKHWFDEELFLGLMRLRGAEAGAASGYAEAFFGRKLRWTWRLGVRILVTGHHGYIGSVLAPCCARRGTTSPDSTPSSIGAATSALRTSSAGRSSSTCET